MLTRAVGAIALSFCLSSTAFAAHRPGLVQRVSCSVVRYYVAKYSASTAEIWARSHGATEAEIVGVLIAVAPALGLARVVSSAPRLAMAIGYDIEEDE